MVPEIARKSRRIMWVGGNQDLSSSIFPDQEVFFVDLKFPRVKDLLDPYFLLGCLTYWKSFFSRHKSTALMLAHSVRIKPDLVFSFLDYNLGIWALKRYRPDLHVWVWQIGRRSIEPGEFLSDLAAGAFSNRYWVDYYHCWGEAVRNYVRQLEGVRCHIVVGGSFRSNLYPVMAPKAENSQTALWISQYRPRKSHIAFSSYNELIVTHEKFYAHDKKVLVRLARQLRKRNIELQILSAGVADSREEEKFYKELDPQLIVHRPQQNIYQYADGFQYIFTVNSSLGYEMISRGKKVGFFDGRCHAIGLPFDTFSQPSDVAPQGLFWTDSIDKIEISRVVEAVVSPLNNAYEDTVKHISKLICVRKPII